jgi:hypothetical protein
MSVDKTTSKTLKQRSIFFHTWGYQPYSYSEGYFYTVIDYTVDLTKTQTSYSSSGQHQTIGTYDEILIDILPGLKSESTEAASCFLLKA